LVARSTARLRAAKYFTQAMETPGLDPDTRNSIEQRIALLGHDAGDAVAVAAPEPGMTDSSNLPESNEVVPMVETPLTSDAGTVPESPPAPAPVQTVDPVLEAQQLGHEATAQP
jgi:hypothetical protein